MTKLFKKKLKSYWESPEHVDFLEQMKEIEERYLNARVYGLSWTNEELLWLGPENLKQIKAKKLYTLIHIIILKMNYLE